jgi:hypothetical protein
VLQFAIMYNLLLYKVTNMGFIATACCFVGFLRSLDLLALIPGFIGAIVSACRRSKQPPANENDAKVRKKIKEGKVSTFVPPWPSLHM